VQVRTFNRESKFEAQEAKEQIAKVAALPQG
jgi:hypothetical protein